MSSSIAIFNSVLDYGSTGSLARGLYEYGRTHGYDSYVLYGRGKKYEDKHLVRIDHPLEVCLHKGLTLCTGYQGRYSNVATSKALALLERQHIERVILLNLHGYYINEEKLLTRLGERNVEVVYVTPDEYAGLGKCCYSEECAKYLTGCGNCSKVKSYPKSLFFDRSSEIYHMKSRAYAGIEKLTVVGPETNLAKFRSSPLLKGRPMKRAAWGVDLSRYKFEINDELYERYGIPRDKIIVTTVANYSNERKGVKRYFFELAKQLEGTDYHFVNVGYDGNLSMDQMPKNMTVIGYVSDQKELIQLYSLSDIYLLASTADTMPISCLISFACETPVCCFYTSGMKYLAPRDSKAIRYCDEISVAALKKIVLCQNKKKHSDRVACRQLAINEYSADAFNHTVYDAFEDSK